MIQALILDVDGVLIGEKIGYNTPNPHEDVIKRLKYINDRGIRIILCTAKPHYSVASIIRSANLHTPHITYAGGVIINPLDNTIVESHPIPKKIVENLIRTCSQHHFYTELYTLDEYYVERTQVSPLTTVHSFVLQRDALQVDSLMDIASSLDVYKIMPIVTNEHGIPAVDAALAPYKDTIMTSWGLHPVANPHQFCGITARGISKRRAVESLLKHLHISPVNTLGVGDSTSDWVFMELCGYVATLENGQNPLKTQVATKNNHGYTGAHVDANGILDIFDHFNLPSSDTHP